MAARSRQRADRARAAQEADGNGPADCARLVARPAGPDGPGNGVAGVYDVVGAGVGVPPVNLRRRLPRARGTAKPCAGLQRQPSEDSREAPWRPPLRDLVDQPVIRELLPQLALLELARARPRNRVHA